ncbi:FtsX-like permease family protein [Dyadobacter flavalbus]|uniref:FtsX-like permease family protein n=1 Tax=Dyadobacter flavalbus TaxID=2579942 RepID=A0A5M8QUN4_9BACT|nr:ABC transporter permease [Dyadobacter flavalbus]KAA6438998.1 FtsX-like permease family protein [Dyadobacter flavalbus]
MLQNYFKVAVRSLLKNKLFSFINIFGLALGMSCSLLIWLWVRDEISYNRFYPNLSRIYFLRSGFDWKGQTGAGMATPGPWQEAIQKQVPEVAAITKMTWNRDLLIKAGEKSTKENGIYATSDFFKVFDTPFINGTAANAIAQPTSIAISRKLAEKYFGTENAVGKTMKVDNKTNFIVSAVFEDIPENATERFDWIINFKVQEQDWMKWWGNSSFKTYALLTPGADPVHAEKVMRQVIKKSAPPELLSFPLLQRFQDVHLYSDYDGLKATGGRIEYVRVFSIVAIFILLIACVNFMNLATARSVKRAKEVGVRKVVGAERKYLAMQFLGESLIVSILACILAMLFVIAALPFFNEVVQKQITLSMSDPSLWLSVTGLLLITGLVAGSYPALYMSALQPIRILKGRLTSTAQGAYLRKGLVVFQFVLSIFLITGMLVIGRQMHYIQTKRLGLDRENVLYIPIEGVLIDKLEVARQEIINSPFVMAATSTGSIPTSITSNSGDLDWPGRDKDLDNMVNATFVGYDFAKTMNIKMIDGRDFSKDFAADTANYIINEAAARMMKMKDPVGKQVTFWMGKGTIIGLMKDFHLSTFHEAIKPLILVNYKGINTEYLMIRARPGKTREALGHVEKVAKSLNPDYPFSYHFLDQDYEKMYRSEMVVNTLIKCFGLLAIVISCLGLLGLAAFTAEQRTKEIGIRKVLGANVGNVVALLSRDLVKLVLLAIVLSTPLAWYATSHWLESFVYRIDLSWEIFVIAGAIAIGIALFTVSFQSIKAAIVNPVKSLKAD